MGNQGMWTGEIVFPGENPVKFVLQHQILALNIYTQVKNRLSKILLRIYRNICIYTDTYVHIATTNENRARIPRREIREYVGAWGQESEGELIALYFNFKNSKK